MVRDEWSGIRPVFDDWLTPAMLLPASQRDRVVEVEEPQVHPALKAAVELVAKLRAAGMAETWLEAGSREERDAIKAQALALAGEAS